MFCNGQLNLYFTALCVANLLGVVSKQFSSNLWRNGDLQYLFWSGLRVLLETEGIGLKTVYILIYNSTELLTEEPSEEAEILLHLGKVKLLNVGKDCPEELVSVYFSFSPLLTVTGLKNLHCF